MPAEAFCFLDSLFLNIQTLRSLRTLQSAHNRTAWHNRRHMTSTALPLGREMCLIWAVLFISGYYGYCNNSMHAVCCSVCMSFHVKPVAFVCNACLSSLWTLHVLPVSCKRCHICHCCIWDRVTVVVMLKLCHEDARGMEVRFNAFLFCTQNAHEWPGSFFNCSSPWRKN
jgi:hypothetical protein